MIPLKDEEPTRINVRWTRLRRYDDVIDGCADDARANLYFIARRFGSADPKIIYIGKTRQLVSTRLGQPDHKDRYRRWKKAYPHQTLWVAHGIISMPDGNLTQKRIDVAERLLTYSTSLDHTENRTNIYSHRINEPYLITSSGSRLSLPKTIRLGVVI